MTKKRAGGSRGRKAPAEVVGSAEGAELVGRAAIVARSADPATVVEKARALVQVLRDFPATDAAAVPSVMEYTRQFQEAYGQGLAADGIYGPATRQALSSILDVLPRDLPAPRHRQQQNAPAPAPGPAPAPAPAPAPQGGPPPVATLEPHPPEAQPAAQPPPYVYPAQPLPGAQAPAPAPAPAGTDGALISREEAARRIAEPFAELCALANILSGALPVSHDAGRVTRAQLAPQLDALSRLLVEAGAEPLAPSMDLDFFNASVPATQVMGLVVPTNLVQQAAQLATDARARAARQRDAVLRYAVAQPVGIVQRFRDAFDALRAAVGAQVQRLASLPANLLPAAERLLSFLRQYVEMMDRSFRNFTDGLIGVAQAGTGLLLALALLAFLVLRKR